MPEASEQEHQATLEKANRMVDQGYCIQAIAEECGLELRDWMDLFRYMGRAKTCGRA